MKVVEEVTLLTGKLKVISPTDSVKDRLAAFYHWGDEQCLHQALLVKKTRYVDLKEIKRWSENEGMLEEYKKFSNEG